MFFNQGAKTGAAGTAIVSIAGTISSVDIGGVGYTTATVSFGSTTGIGTTTRAFGSVIIGAAGTVTGIAIKVLMSDTLIQMFLLFLLVHLLMWKKKIQLHLWWRSRSYCWAWYHNNCF